MTNINNLESDVNKFITSQIPLKSVQIQVRLFNCNNKSTLAILINHMCMDGVDVKYICYQICYNYNNFLKGNKVIDIKIGKRDHNEIYADFNKQDQKAAKRLYKNITLTKSKVKFPWSKKSKEDKSNIVVHKLNKHQYDKLKYIAKQYHNTLNTTLIAVFFHSLYELCNVEPHNPIIVQCAIDLRRHLKDKGINLGLTNHTGFFPCELSHRCDTIKQTLVETIKTIELIKNDKFIGLHGIALLNLGYHLFPNRIMKWLIRIGYRNPLIGMSNIGIIDDNKLQFGTTKLVDGYITGAIKYKPYMQLALTTLNDVITMTIAIKGNDQDKKAIEKFYELLDKNIEKL